MKLLQLPSIRSRAVLEAVGVLLVAGLLWGCTPSRVASIQVLDFEPTCPQPEVDVLVKRIPDLIAKELRRLDVADTVSRDAVEDPDVIVTGMVTAYQPSKGFQKLLSRDAVFVTSIEIKCCHLDRDDQIRNLSYSYENWFQPEHGVVRTILYSIGVLVYNVCAFPINAVNGFPYHEDDFAEEAADFVYDHIQDFYPEQRG